MNTVQYCIVVQRSENGYCAYSPDVPGCVAADDSFEATLQLMAEALEFHLEGLLEHGEQVPEPKALRFHLDSGAWEFTDEDIYAYVSVAIPEPA